MEKVQAGRGACRARYANWRWAGVKECLGGHYHTAASAKTTTGVVTSNVGFFASSAAPKTEGGHAMNREAGRWVLGCVGSCPKPSE